MMIETNETVSGTNGKKGGRVSKPFHRAIEQNVLDSLVYRGMISLADVSTALDDSKMAVLTSKRYSSTAIVSRKMRWGPP